MFFVSTLMLFVARSTPMVVLVFILNSFFVNRDNRLDFPTSESPIRTTEKGKYISSVTDRHQALCIRIACGLHRINRLRRYDLVCRSAYTHLYTESRIRRSRISSRVSWASGNGNDINFE